MALQRYPEKGERLRFVVQKHSARSPHFDFRLELDGVLKSWAIPKAPAGDSATAKRLAVQTEDQPLESAGHIDIWDRGTWVPEGAALASFRRGSLKFELKGKRMKGRWALMRMGNASTRKKDLWILVKREEAVESKPPPPARAARGKSVRQEDARR
jgi:bifunctional non-homologous end joining protein LigD